ncbi:hypothetical protein HYQ44_017853 [Verticillium longisporum]|nr:hypothetical protein HYQ44_017853 [Verticillium longisporum]
MRYTLASLASLAAAAQGLATRGDQCPFHLKAAGSVSGNIGQLSSGQARIGLSPTTFKLEGDTAWDSQGRGCWWTPPTKLLQCDIGQIPEKGWKFECDGSVSFNGQKEFYQCEADNGQYNIYLLNNQGQNCAKVTLTSDGCLPGCPKPKPTEAPPTCPPKETVTVTQVITQGCPTPTPHIQVKVVSPPPASQPVPPPPSPKTCPTNLSGPYEFPHLIIPVDSSNPDKAPGTSYNGQADSKISSIFNFDIPGSYKGKTCSLVFLFPKKEDLETSDWKFSGSGELVFSKLKGVATQKTTANNAPAVESELKTVQIAPGNGYSIATFDCPAGTAVSFQMKSKGDTSLWFFEDYNPSPLGLYITVC